ncbi:hypothetical protein IJ531_03400 [bacterium]|nr:hypothetical protein [bacterium]
MIQPIKSNISFQGTPSAFDKVAKQPAAATAAAPQPQTVTEPETQKKKGGIRQGFHNAKVGVMNFLKGFNNIKDTTAGAIRGIAEGAAATAIIGTVGHNFIKSERKIGKTITGTIGDVFKLPVNFCKYIGNSKLLKDIAGTIGDIFKLPGKFYKYMGSGKLIALTAVISAGIIAFRTIQGKINANKANADIDHALNEGHTK